MGENGDQPVTGPTEHPAMTVHCPHCSTGYLLPDHLVGPKGARVSCPECRGEFAVWRERAQIEGSESAGLQAGETADATPARAAGETAMQADSGANVALLDAPGEIPVEVPAPESDQSAGEPVVAAAAVHDVVADRASEPAAVAIAASVLDALEETLGGGALRDASRRGKAFAEHGPAILDAFAEFQRRAGERGTAACFRAALRDRCGINLETAGSASSPSGVGDAGR